MITLVALKRTIVWIISGLDMTRPLSSWPTLSCAILPAPPTNRQWHGHDQTQAHTHMNRQYIGTLVHWQEVKTHPVSFRTFFLFFSLGTFITVSSYSQMTSAVNVNSRKFKIPKWKNKTIPISARITGGNVRDAAQQSIEQKQLDLLFFALSNLLADKPGTIKARACLRGKGEKRILSRLCLNFSTKVTTAGALKNSCWALRKQVGVRFEQVLSQLRQMLWGGVKHTPV